MGTGDQLTDELESEMNDLEEDYSTWTYRGNKYKIPLFGPCATNEMLKLGTVIDEGNLAGNPIELAKFIFDYMKEMLSQKNDVDDDHIRKISNIKTMKEVFSVWFGKGQ